MRGQKNNVYVSMYSVCESDSRSWQASGSGHGLTRLEVSFKSQLTVLLTSTFILFSSRSFFQQAEKTEADSTLLAVNRLTTTGRPTELLHKQARHRLAALYVCRGRIL